MTVCKAPSQLTSNVCWCAAAMQHQQVLQSDQMAQLGLKPWPAAAEAEEPRQGV